MRAHPPLNSTPRTPTTPSGRLVVGLLTFAAAPGGACSFGNDGDVVLDADALRYVEIAGLLPLLGAALGACLERLPREQQDRLRAADLTARVRHAERERTALRVIIACEELGVPITLLKGIVMAARYPAAHLRQMGDVDVLVSREDRPRLQARLQRCGFVALSGDWAEAAHGAPLRDPDNGVWVEVHDALFPANAARISRELFARESVQERSVCGEFCGRPIKRLCNELELVYLAAAWVRDLCSHAMHPSFLVPLVDAARLVGGDGRSIDWELVIDLLDDELAAAPLSLMLRCLDRHGVAGSARPAVTGILRQRGGTIESAILLAMLDHWLIDGRHSPLGWRARFVWSALLDAGTPAMKIASLPWHVLFPRDIPDRFTLRHLVRLTHAVRRGLRGVQPRPLAPGEGSTPARAKPGQRR